jgi:hypothetical protein
MTNVWTPSDYSNVLTVGSAAIGSIMLIVFKSRCSNVKLCCGLLSCDRKVKDDEENPRLETIPENNP